ncbi:MAG: porphobilinogen synthase [Chloroflexota bacterium]|nr:porphobilinogen synthase [Chloroflexota bacterium]
MSELGHFSDRGELPPFRRMRRLRRTPAIRRLVRETTLAADDFIYPLFVIHGTGVRDEIGSMPGQFQLSVDALPRELDELNELGIGAVLLFGIPAEKDAVGSGGFAGDGVVQQAVGAIKRHAPDMLVITDVCACEYTDHGHCGILAGPDVDNDLTLALLARIALSQAAAGADIVAPSDMMDGRVGIIRAALDQAGHEQIPIMSYAAKYASAYYGPFREAVASTPAFGDRRSHQMDPANAREAMTEIAIDLEEGADLIIVKPALAYLDVIRQARDEFSMPLLAYNVSGEYAMIKAAGRLGWIDERRVTLETLTAIKRAGAGRIITYHAKEAARWLDEELADVRRPVVASAGGRG